LWGWCVRGEAGPFGGRRGGGGVGINVYVLYSTINAAALALMAGLVRRFSSTNITTTTTTTITATATTTSHHNINPVRSIELTRDRESVASR